MISSLMWVARGVAKSNPVEYKPSEQELEQLKHEAEREAAALLDDEDNEMTDEQPSAATALPDVTNDPELAEFNMDQYDQEEGGVMMSGAGMKGMMYFENKGDPYVVMNDDTEESDADDWVIRPTDNLIVCAKTDDDIPTLEVYVVEGDSDLNMYPHHEIMMTAFPLCVEWVSFSLTQLTLGAPANLVAVGSFHPGIEIWDLDVIDAPSPVITLGGADTSQQPVALASEADVSSKKGKKKKKKAQQQAPPLRQGSHTDAVMCLSWNGLQRNLLASGSADQTVKVWDLSASGQCVTTLSHHTDKVQCCSWHRVERTVLATASYDRTARLADVRSHDNAAKWRLSADAECIQWGRPEQLFVSTEDGNVLCIDVRNTTKPLYTLQAHHSATNTIAFDKFVPNLMATGSIDKSIKLWDTTGDKPQHIDTITGDIGTVFTASFCSDAPFVLAVAGGKGKLNVIDCSKRPKVEKHFSEWLSQNVNVAN